MRSALLCGILMAAASPAWAASVLDFPRLSFEPDVITGVAIVNPTGENADVAITAYGSDGSVLAVRNVQVPAGRQVSMLTVQLFGAELPPNAAGWFQGFSMTTGLTGFFLVLNTQGTEFDGADLPPRARRIAFNQIQVGEGFSTELNIVNTGGEAVEAELTLVGAGEEPLARVVQLAPRGAARLDVGEFFDQQQVSPGAYVLARAPQDLVGFEFVRTGRDLQGLNARNASEFLNTIYFPQVSVLGPFETRLGLVNLSGDPVIVTVTAHGPDGGLFVEEVRANPVAVALGPGESLSRDLVELFGFQGEEGLEGWLELTSTSAAINGYLGFRIPEIGAAATLTPVAQGTRNVIFSHLATALGFFTGVAALNPSSLPASFRVVAQARDGQLLGAFDGVLAPGQRISQLVTELIPEAAGQAGGLLLVRASVPLFVSSFFGTADGTILSNISAQESLPDFRPDAALPSPSVGPRLAVLQTGESMAFQVRGLDGAVEWRVDGVVGGSEETGTIDANGIYTAPDQPPTVLPVVVTAVSGARSAAASVDVVSLDAISTGLGLVQSLAYLNGLERLFTAELGAVGAFSAARSGPSQGILSTIFSEGSSGDRVPLVDLEDEVPKMIRFVARDNQEYLLLAARTSGRILRIDPRTGAILTVASNLNLPTAIVLDPVTGNLLVAEAEQITSIPRRQLESDLTPAQQRLEPDRPGRVRTALLTPIGGVRGIFVDACTGQVYLAQQGGALIEYRRDSGEFDAILEGLGDPGQMAGFYRSGVSCPDSFQLLIIEEGADQLTLLAPATGDVVSPWVPDIDLDDITLLPEDSPFEGIVAFNETDVDEEGQESNSLFAVNLPGLYDEGPINPPQMEIVPFTVSPPGPDLSANESAATAGQTASVNIFYRPGDDDGQEGGSDETDILLFVIDYDETRLRFDPTDTNSDGIPDAVLPDTPPGFDVFVAFDADAPEGELGFFVFDPTGSPATLPEGNLLTVSFRVLDGSVGTTDLAFSPALPPQAADSRGSRFSFDEVADGTVSIAP